MLPQLLCTIRRERPGIVARVAVNNWRNLLQLLRTEEIDFFVANSHDFGAEEDLHVTPLCRLHHPVACRPGHPLLSMPERQPVDMLPYQFASITIPHEMKPQVRKLLGVRAGAPLPIAVECDSIAVLTSVVKQSDLIFLAPQAAASEEIAAGTLVPLDFEQMAGLFAQIDIITLAERSLSPGARYVLDTLHQIAAEVSAPPV